MWPFNRKKNEGTEAVPAEVQEYYQAEKRERMGLAWALAFITLAVAVGVALGLFFGGRALYRHFNNKKVATTQPATKPTEAETSTPSSSTDTQAANPNASSSSNPSSQPPSSSSSSSSQPSSNTGQAGKGSMVNTGPGDTAAVGFAITSIVGFGLYELRLRRRLAR